MKDNPYSMRHETYADKVMALGAKMVKDDKLWGLVPQKEVPR